MEPGAGPILIEAVAAANTASDEADAAGIAVDDACIGVSVVAEVAEVTEVTEVTEVADVADVTEVTEVADDEGFVGVADNAEVAEVEKDADAALNADGSDAWAVLDEDAFSSRTGCSSRDRLPENLRYLSEKASKSRSKNG